MTYSVPFTALTGQVAEIKKELMDAFETVLEGGQYILGPEVSAFERGFARYCETKFAIGLASGTCALHLALRSVGLKENDEVITVPNSFLATASSIVLAGARPVFVDIRPDLNIDPDCIEAAITTRTKAIIPVHLTGRPAPMLEILDICRRYNLFVLEDAAQAIGAKLHGRPMGSWGDAACFSVHPLKNLHAFGDGGLVTTSDPSLLEHLAKARNHGLKNRDECDFWSFNCRLDEVHAAMLRVQLHHLDRWTEERRKMAFRYNDLLRPYVEVPDEGPGEYCVYQTYMVQADQRDALSRYLDQNGVQALVHYPIPIHLQEAARKLGYSADDFPVTMRASSRILSLPIYFGMSFAQQDRVVELIADFYRNRSRRG